MFKLLVPATVPATVIPLLTVTVVLGATIGIRSHKSKELTGVALVALFVCVTAVGLAAYRHSIFTHYVIFCVPAATLLLAWCLSQFTKVHQAMTVVVASSAVFVSLLQFPHYSFAPAGPTFAELEHVAQTIHAQLQPNERYIVVLLSESHDILGMNYRYFLSTDKAKSPLEPGTFDAETLVVINEEKKTDRPQDLPIYEIVTFPTKTPTQVIRSETEADIYLFRRQPQG